MYINLLIINTQRIKLILLGVVQSRGSKLSLKFQFCYDYLKLHYFTQRVDFSPEYGMEVIISMILWGRP